MQIEKNIKVKFSELLLSGNQIKQGNEHGTIRGNNHEQECKAWLASAQNIVHLIIYNKDSPYRLWVDKICKEEHGYGINNAVGEVCGILQNLFSDIDSGLLSSIENKTQAFVFDNFLDHAKSYLQNDMYKEAGVISGVVFEDSLRSICRKDDIEEKNIKLDSLIDKLVKKGTLTQVKAKRARVSAHVRTKATHAQWREFDINDVKTTIDFTEELIENWLDK